MAAIEPVLVSCPSCRAELRLPSTTPEGRVRCPKCKVIFAPVVDVEVFSESVAVAIDAPPRDPDDAFFERLAKSDEEPQKRAEVPLEAEAVVEPARPEPRRLSRKSSGYGIVVAIVALCSLVVLGGFAGASYLAYMILAQSPTPQETVNAGTKPDETRSAIPDAAMAKVKAATVFVRTKYPDGQATTSSGFFVPGPGLVLTNARSVGQGKKPIAVSKIHVVIGSRTLAARLIGSDADLDLSLLQVAGLDLPEPLALNADTFLVKEPQPVIVFSRPPDGSTIATNARISGQRTVSGTRPWFEIGGWVPHGSWGGPVADATGRVIGAAGVIPGTETVSAVPAESVLAFLQTAVQSVEASGPIAMLPEETKKKPRDEPEGNMIPEGFGGRFQQPRFDPGFQGGGLPQLPPGFNPPVFPQMPQFEGRLGRPGMRPDFPPRPREPEPDQKRRD